MLFPFLARGRSIRRGAPLRRQPRRCNLAVEQMEGRALLSAIRPGFDTSTLARTDDGSTDLVSLGFSTPVNFYGFNFSSDYVNNNGNITFDQPFSVYTPFNL